MCGFVAELYHLSCPLPAIGVDHLKCDVVINAVRGAECPLRNPYLT